MRITTLSSGLITTQALTSGAASAALAVPANGTWKPSARPAEPASAAERAEKRAAVDVRHHCHGDLPRHALAVAWIAARTRWKVPQRQMLVIAASMSASVGFGFSWSNAATAMIMPLWQ